MGLGRITARTAIVHQLEPLIAAVTDLTRHQVSRRLAGVHGRQILRNVFVDEWPRDADSLGGLRVATVRKAELWEELSEVTGFDAATLESHLESVHGRTLLRNVMATELFGEEAYEPEEWFGYAAGDPVLWHDAHQGEYWSARIADPRAYREPLAPGLVRVVFSDHSYLDTSPDSLSRRDEDDDVGEVDEGSDELPERERPVSAALHDDGANERRSQEWTTGSLMNDSVSAERLADQHADRPGRADSSGPGSESSGRALAGSVLCDRYRLERQIGRGGFGTVYETHDTLLDEVVVVKVSRGPEHEVLLTKEAKLTWRLSHPSICRAWLDVDPGVGRFLVLEHGGQSVGDLLDAAGPMAADYALDVVRQIADALDFVHERGIIHFDVSCGNVLIGEDGRARLVDFGAGREGRFETREAHGPTVVATAHFAQPQYAAPEQAIGEGRARSDQYSLGLVLLSMLTGQVLRERYERAREHPKWDVPGLSANQRLHLERALEMDPSRRFRSCGEFVENLLAVRRAEGDDELLRQRAEELLQRLVKVLPGDESETRELGLSMRAAGALEAFLRSAAHFLLRRSPRGDDQVRKYLGPGVTIDRATCTPLANLVRSFGNKPAARDPQVAWLVEDLSRSHSVVRRAIADRNDLAHGRAFTLPQVDAHALATLLRGQLRM